MLKVTYDETHNCLILEPSGTLAQEDFSALANRFDELSQGTDKVPNLVIHATQFPGWEDFSAFFSHLRFVEKHHRLVTKVALVSDARILDLAPRVVTHFVAADVRHFPADHLEEALAWVGADEAPSTNVTVIPGLPDDVVAISVENVVSARDYAMVIEPLIKEKLSHHSRIKILYRIGPDFASFTPGAVWSDARVGLGNLGQFARVAIVTDVDWIRHATKLFAPLISGEVQVFSDDSLAEAKLWITK